ncbi:MAG: phosphate/phosphite/phosphonate ABC transporter substrate-binding protein [Chloroflexales bacterium]|nr:phosphate/phosphite/phosphonate ABC transporter substrate-binding protein [Chloroflexales bacterium]
MKLTSYKHVLLAILVMAGLIVAGCGASSSETGASADAGQVRAVSEVNNASEAADDRADWPEKFMVGFFGGDDAEEVLEQQEPKRAYLEEKLGIPVEAFTGASYSAVIEAMRAERVDAMEVGPFSYILAVQEANAEAVAVGISTRADPAVYDPEEPAHYISVIMTKKGSGIETLDDLRGLDFTFVDPASTSGHLAPKTLLIQNGLDPDTEMNTVFAGSHPSSVEAIWNDKVPAGATNEGRLYRMMDEGIIEFCSFPDEQLGKVRTPEEVKEVYDNCPDGHIAIVAMTDPIPNTPFAVRQALPQSFKDAVQQALLEYKDNAELVATTKRWYIDPREELPNLATIDQYYNPLRDIAQLLDLDLRELSDPKINWPDEFVVGLFVGDDADAALKNNEPLRVYLEETLGIPVRVETGTSYSAVIEAMRAKRVDAMEVGPFSFVLAEREAGAEPLAVRASEDREAAAFDENVFPYYFSVFVTKKGSGVRTLQDLEGIDFAFVDPASTSGRNAPVVRLINEIDGLETPEDVDNWLNPTFAGSHPTAILALQNDNVQTAVTYEGNLINLRDEGQAEVCGFAEGRVGIPLSQEELDSIYEACPEGRLVVIAQSDPIPNTPFSIRPDLPDSFKTAVREALLGIKDNPEVLSAFGTWYVDPTEVLEGVESTSAFYDVVRDIAAITVEE